MVAATSWKYYWPHLQWSSQNFASIHFEPTRRSWDYNIECILTTWRQKISRLYYAETHDVEWFESYGSSRREIVGRSGIVLEAPSPYELNGQLESGPTIMSPPQIIRIDSYASPISLLGSSGVMAAFNNHFARDLRASEGPWSKVKALDEWLLAGFGEMHCIFKVFRNS